MSEVLKGQVAGDHYVNLAMQPVEFAMRNKYDFCCASALKYLTRWRAKAGVQDLRKGKHFIEFRETFREDALQAGDVVPIFHYCEMNEIRGIDRAVLTSLHAYALWPTPLLAAQTINWIETLILEGLSHAR